MTMPVKGHAGRGLALGAWGAAQATAAGLAIAIGGALRDVVGALAMNRRSWGEALATPATGYSVVYHTEIGLLSSPSSPSGRSCATGHASPQPNETPGRSAWPISHLTPPKGGHHMVNILWQLRSGEPLASGCSGSSSPC